MMDKEQDKEDAIKEDKTGEEFSLDFSWFKGIFSNKKLLTTIITILLILIPVILTIYIRVQPQYLPVTDQWAQNSVYNYYRNAIADQVNAQYPNLPSQSKQTMIDTQFKDFLASNKDQMDLQIKSTSEYFKAGFRYQENNVTYTFLGDLDSYYYLRFARNLLEKGSYCDEIKDGVCFDDHMMAPWGAPVSFSLHPFGMFYLYEILHTFNSKINLMYAAFLLPTVLAVLAAVAAFFLGRKIMNNTAGFFAAMLVAASPLIISRTLGADTDIWNVMFALIIIWIFIEAFESKELWKKLTLTCVTALLFAIFSFAWSGWWYSFDFIAVTIIGYLVFTILKNFLNEYHPHSVLHVILAIVFTLPYLVYVTFVSITNRKNSHRKTKTLTKEVRDNGMAFILMVVLTGVLVTSFVGFNAFKATYTAAIDATAHLKIASQSNLWPNVYTTVAELNAADLSSIVGQTAFGVNVLFSLALLGIVFTMVKKKPDFKEYLLIAFAAIIDIFLISSTALQMNLYLYFFLLLLPIAIGMIMLLVEKREGKEHEIDMKPAFLLAVWVIGMIFASTKGVRFILLLIPPLAVALGVAIGYIYQYFSRWINQDFKLNETITKVGVFLLLCLILITPITIGISAGKQFVPSLTKGWYDSLIKIRDQSQPNAIINSWWDFGHWFKYFADRAVTLDGASQNHPDAHWLGKILQTNNEAETIGILRMLDCGSNNAFDEIDKKYHDTEESENVVNKIILMTKDDANTYLLSLGYTNDETEKILSFTHCTPPEDYLITSEDMVGKGGVWAHFGLWDFDKAFIINEVRPKDFDEGTKLLKERFNYTDEEASKIYYDVQGLQTDREMNDWISPWPSYTTTSMTDCTSKNEIVVCAINIGLGSNGQSNVVIEKALINLTNPSVSQVLLGIYDSNNQRTGENVAALSEIVIADDKITKYKGADAIIGMSLLLDVTTVTTGNQTTKKYAALIADPLLIDSTFTKLFFLDGKYMPHFEKFSDITDITGSRIIVWKVKWN